MSRAAVTALTIFGCFFATTARPQVPDPDTVGGGSVVEPVGGSEDQHLNGTTQISGESVLGIVLGEPAGSSPAASALAARPLPARVYLYRPRSDADICLQLRSIDGRVISSSEYHLRSVSGSFVTLAVRPSLALAAYQPNEIVVTAAYQANCTGLNGPLALAVLRPQPNEELGLAINPGTDMDAFFYRKSGDEGVRTSCDTAPGARAVIFTEICWFSLAELAAPDGVSIHTQSREGLGPSIDFRFTTSAAGR